ncbi:MAG: MauE/DoxX family redox-associated membrane protein [Nodosilinea sp.]
MHWLKTVSKYFMALFYSLAGANHFLNSDFYLSMMPPYLPWHEFLVALSGGFEILLGALLLVPKYSSLAAWGLIALLIAVFPANIHMATHAELFPAISPTLLWVRLPLQAVLMAWAYWHTRPTLTAPSGA